MLTAGVISLVSKSSNQIKLAVTAASGGTGPYTNQWYRDTTSGFTPGGGNILAGKTALTLTDVVIPDTQYYYKVVQIDTGHSNDEVTASQLGVKSDGASQSPNQFTEAPVVGMLDQLVGPTNVIAVEIDQSESGTLVQGQSVKMYDSAGGVPKVVACDADDDEVLGFIRYNIKNKTFVAGSACEIALKGSVMYLYAAGAVARGEQVTVVTASPGTVQAANATDTIVGWAFDKAAAYGDLIRIYLETPSFEVAS
jgi:hypothetical protein